MRNWLKSLRLSKGLSQGELGSMIGLSIQQYSYLELGDRQKDMPLSIAVKIASIFNISVEDIAEYDKDVFKND